VGFASTKKSVRPSDQTLGYAKKHVGVNKVKPVFSPPQKCIFPFILPGGDGADEFLKKKFNILAVRSIESKKAEGIRIIALV
jgi:hypothetical protein